MVGDTISLKFPARTQRDQDTTFSTEYEFGVAKVETHSDWSRKQESGFRLHASVSDKDISALSWALPDPKAAGRLRLSVKLATPESSGVLIRVEAKRQHRTAVSQTFEVTSQEPVAIEVDIPKYKAGLEITVSAISLQTNPRPAQVVVDISEPTLTLRGRRK